MTDYLVQTDRSTQHHLAAVRRAECLGQRAYCYNALGQFQEAWDETKAAIRLGRHSSWVAWDQQGASVLVLVIV